MLQNFEDDDPFYDVIEVQVFKYLTKVNEDEIEEGVDLEEDSNMQS